MVGKTAKASQICDVRLQVYSKQSLLFFLSSFLLCCGQNEPLYLGKFLDTTHAVDGDIFVLDERTIYIQDFAHDGQVKEK